MSAKDEAEQMSGMTGQDSTAGGGFENVVTLDDVLPSQRMMVSLDGFEGPLDLLLNLARTQKVDLTKLSILELAEQYLAYIAEARAMRLEIAADYLVMAAWLAFLKSKLLLPADERPEEDGLSGEEMALHLAFRLKRLEAMREAVAALFNRHQLGVDFFARGLPEGIKTVRKSEYWASVYDLLKAYADQRSKAAVPPVKMGARTAWSINEARAILERLVGAQRDWAILDTYIADYLVDSAVSKTALASSFGATLELTREGYTELRQARPFAPIYIKWLKTPEPGRSAIEEPVPG